MIDLSQSRITRSTKRGELAQTQVVRWPGHIKPGTVKNQLFAALDWLPTFLDIAGGPKGDGLKEKIEAGSYPGIVKDPQPRKCSALWRMT